MADQKATALTALTSVNDADVLYIVDDPGGTPLSRKITRANLLNIGTDVQAFDAVLDDLAALSAVADNEFIVGTGAGTYDHEAASTLPATIGGVIQDLDTLGANSADSEFLVGTGVGALAWESGATARTSLGVGTTDTPEFDGLVIGNSTGIDANPGSDIDTDLITVGVTGTPVLKWDESENAFDFSTIIQIPTTTSTVGIIQQNGNRVFHTFNANNVFIGQNSGNLTLSGQWCVGVGFQTLSALTSGFNSVGIGYFALNALTSGDNNLGMGTNSLVALTTGSHNVAVGANTLKGSVSDTQNVALGTDALFACDGGSSNIGIGRFSLADLSTGDQNIGIGVQASIRNGTGSNNVSIGYFSGQGTFGTSNSQNVFIGSSSGQAISTGGDNVCVGYQAGNVITSGGSNIIIGSGTDPTGATVSDELNIGDVLFGTLTANQNLTINAATISVDYDLMLAGDGVLGMSETTTPTADTNYGKVYCKSDNKLYFQDGAGTEHEVAFV